MIARWLIAVALGAALIAPQATVAAERAFPTTGFTVAGPFLTFYESRGGLDLFGYPRSPEFSLNGRTVQYFQRARFEWWPENPPGHQVQLGLLADELGRGRPPDRSTDREERRHFPETGHAISGAFRAAFESRGGLEIFGYPISPVVVENARVVQYFQRARLEWHPENVPAYQVQLGLLGDEQIALGRVTLPAGSAAPAAAEPALVVAGMAAEGPLAGRLVVSGGVGGPIWTMRPDGSDRRLVGHGVDPSLSPDGQIVVYAQHGGARPGLYLVPWQGGEPALLTAGDELRGPLYSPNGREIAFYQKSACLRPAGHLWIHDSCFQIKVIPADGGVDWLPPGQDRYAFGPAWRPDGRGLVFRQEKALATTEDRQTVRPFGTDFAPLIETIMFDPRGGRIVVGMRRNQTYSEIGTIPDDGSDRFSSLTPPPPFVQSPPTNLSPAYSPDGRHIAFISDRDGRPGVWIMTSDGANPRRVSDVPIVLAGARERLVHWARG